MTSPLRAFTNRRTAVLTGLGFSSGLPSVLVADTLQAWMSKSRVDLPTIAIVTGAVGWPYALKFLWAPLVDRETLPFLGRRRGWLLATQILVAAAIVALGLGGRPGDIGGFAAMAFLVSFFSATQDIVADAYRTDVLRPEELGAGAAVFTTGYRVGMVASGAGALALAGAGLSWSAVYAIAACAMIVGVAATFLAPEPEHHTERTGSFASAVTVPLRALLARADGPTALAFVAVFKLPDVIGASYATPFLLDRGYTLTQLAAVRGLVGVGIGIAGTICGGAVVVRLGIRRSLWIFGVLHAVTNLGFCLLSRAEPNLAAMTAVIVIENFCIGLATAGFMAFLMSRCDARHSASQYALLTALVALTRYAVVMPLGAVQVAIGWTWFFALATIVGLPSLFLIPRLRLPGDEPPTAPAE